MPPRRAAATPKRIATPTRNAPKRAATTPPKQRRSTSPAGARIEAVSKKLQAKANAYDKYWENSDGCHGTPFYCSGRPRPLFRGQLHFWSAVASPLWIGYQLSLCQTAGETAVVLLASLGAVSMLGASGCYHTMNWKDEPTELLAGKMDYSAIYMQIAFSGAPLYHLLVPSPYNWGVIGITSFCAVLGVLMTFGSGSFMFNGQYDSRHLGTVIYAIMGGAQVLPLTSRLFSNDSAWSLLVPSEQNMILTLTFAYLVGSMIYANAKPKLWQSVFGFHELWHLLVVVGTACSYGVNTSLLLRRAGVAA